MITVDDVIKNMLDRARNARELGDDHMVHSSAIADMLEHFATQMADAMANSIEGGGGFVTPAGLHDSVAGSGAILVNPPFAKVEGEKKEKNFTRITLDNEVMVATYGRNHVFAAKVDVNRISKYCQILYFVDKKPIGSSMLYTGKWPAVDVASRTIQSLRRRADKKRQVHVPTDEEVGK